MSLSHSPSIITDNLGFYVDFNNVKSVSGTTLTDMSSNRIAITLTNPAANTMTIANGYAEFTPASVDFSTSTYYTISNSYFNNIKNEISLETCMYVTSDFGNTQGVRGVSPRVTESASPLGFSIASTGIHYEVNTTTGWKTGFSASSNSGYNKWVYVTQTTSVTEDLFKTYINGKLVGQISLGGSTPNGGNGFLIGRGYYGGIKNYSGRVSMMRVYSKKLSETEVLQNFNSLRGRYGL